MSSSTSLFAELEGAVKNGSPEKRADTLRRVISLFLKEFRSNSTNSRSACSMMSLAI